MTPCNDSVNDVTVHGYPPAVPDRFDAERLPAPVARASLDAAFPGLPESVELGEAGRRARAAASAALNIFVDTLLNDEAILEAAARAYAGERWWDSLPVDNEQKETHRRTKIGRAHV